MSRAYYSQLLQLREARVAVFVRASGAVVGSRPGVRRGSGAGSVRDCQPPTMLVQFEELPSQGSGAVRWISTLGLGS